MGCLLHEEPRIDEEEVVRLTPAGSYSEANDWCMSLLEAGLRCRIVCERVGSPLTRGPVDPMLPVIYVHPDDLRMARVILNNVTRQIVLPYSISPRC